MKKRADNELPLAVKKWGWKYHHLGIPVKDSFQDENYIPHLKIYVGGFETNPFGIERMRFEEGSTCHELVKSYPHLAFEVTNIEEALACGKFELLSEINSPSKGVRVVMISHEGIPVELIEFER